MMLLKLLLASFLYAAEPLKVAVIDSGLDNNSQISVCEQHDFTGTGHGESMKGHGSNVSGLIDIYVGTKKSRYCQVIVKAFANKTAKASYEDSLAALEYVANRKDIKFVNYSAGGPAFTHKERSIIQRMVNEGKVVVVAAGNLSHNLDKNCNYFPACYNDKLIVVGNWIKLNKPHSSSNYGKYVKAWELGVAKCANSYCKTGTSQATAIHTGKLINQFLKDE